MREKTARIKMLGNMWEYVVGEEYDVPLDRANQLTGLGMAVLVEDQAQPAEEKA
jgi:hypothetical protein